MQESSEYRERGVKDNELSFAQFREEVLADFALVCLSREASLLGRKEVLTGKAKFGIFGDGKELAQVAMAKCFRDGDFRSGYYRDQTFIFATGMLDVEQFFAQLYAIPDVEADPASAGRQMNAHFATRSLDGEGMWKELKHMKNSSADTSPTSSQMPRAVGLALASKIYRENDVLGETPFSDHGNEVTFVTIGDASTSEGMFWESINAAGVMRIPMVTFIWDDGYGISVPQKYQTTKQDLSALLSGFSLDEKGEGIQLYAVKGWDYPALVSAFREGVDLARRDHIPVIFHVTEMTQPQGHSTSGSHERYKSKERLAWEEEFDCIRKMREWIISTGISDEENLDNLQREMKEKARSAQRAAWQLHVMSIKSDMDVLFTLLEGLQAESSAGAIIGKLAGDLRATLDPIRRDVMKAAREALYATAGEQGEARGKLLSWVQQYGALNRERYNAHLYSESVHAATFVEPVHAVYPEEPEMLNGFEILNRCFDFHLRNNPAFFAFGEDLGKIGDVNQGFAGLQEKYGERKVFDTGIRETTIIGQGIGMAMRGLRPLAEIQYLDYLLYGLEPLSDDLATLQYRTFGGQKAPLIIRTRGHRLEGIWHTGSPLGMILHACRGIHICVPRNMTQASGMYNTLLQSDEPGLVIECLNGYRLKEALPENIGTFTIPLGVPEILREGEDITIVSYGSLLRIIEEAANALSAKGISVEVVDVQTLLPFDSSGVIRRSVRKTNRVLFVDEDVPGGATAYMMQQVFEDTEMFRWLDAFPQCLSAQANRSAYASDGDYFCKPNAEDIFEAVYAIMHEVSPARFPRIY